MSFSRRYRVQCVTSVMFVVVMATSCLDGKSRLPLHRKQRILVSQLRTSTLHIKPLSALSPDSFVFSVLCLAIFSLLSRWHVGDTTAMRLNTLVDWLEDKPTELSDPRRCIPSNIAQGRLKGIYCRLTLTKENTRAWKELELTGCFTRYGPYSLRSYLFFPISENPRYTTSTQLDDVQDDTDLCEREC
jgi:hypothetical protein